MKDAIRILPGSKWHATVRAWTLCAAYLASGQTLKYAFKMKNKQKFHKTTNYDHSDVMWQSDKTECGGTVGLAKTSVLRTLSLSIQHTSTYDAML